MEELEKLEKTLFLHKAEFDEKLYNHLAAILQTYRALEQFYNLNSHKDLVVDFSFCYWKGWQWRSFKVWDSNRMVHFDGYNDIVLILTNIFKDIQDVYLPVNPEKSNYDFNIYTKVLDFDSLFKSLLDKHNQVFINYLMLLENISDNKSGSSTRTKI